MRAFGAVDAVIILALICGIFAAVPMLATGRPDKIVVFRQNAVVAEYPLFVDAAFSVSGKNGPVDIEIKNGAAKIIHADCPRSICKQSGSVSNSYGRLICAPNNILIRVQPSRSGGVDVDGVAY